MNFESNVNVLLFCWHSLLQHSYSCRVANVFSSKFHLKPLPLSTFNHSDVFVVAVWCSQTKMLIFPFSDTHTNLNSLSLSQFIRLQTQIANRCSSGYFNVPNRRSTHNFTVFKTREKECNVNAFLISKFFSQFTVFFSFFFARI